MCRLRAFIRRLLRLYGIGLHAQWVGEWLSVLSAHALLDSIRRVTVGRGCLVSSYCVQSLGRAERLGIS